MKKERKNNVEHSAILGEGVSFNKTLRATISNGLGDITNQAKRYSNNTIESMTGFVAEADHCSTFNARNALKRSNVKAVREPNGTHGDYKIVKGNKVIVEGEVKYYKSAEGTERAMRGYENKQLVGPSDQINDIKKIARRKEISNRSTGKPNRVKVAEEHKKVNQNVSESITDGKTKSTPRTRKEMRKIAKKAKNNNLKDTDIMPSAKEALKEASISGAKSGAKTGVIFGGGIEAIKNIGAVINGEKDIEDAIVDTGIEVVKSGADGAVKGVASSAATTGATYIAEKVGSEVAKKVLKSSAPAAVAVGLVEVAKDAVKFTTGDIDGEEFAKSTAKTAVTTAGGWAGAEAGAAIGTLICPGIGTVLGGLVGGIGGSLGLGSLFD